MIKKFTTFLLAFAIVLSISTPKSSAAGGAIGTVVGSVAKYTFGAVTTELILRAAQNGLETYFSKPQTKEFAENLIAEGIFSLADYIAAGFTDQDCYDQFTNYNAQLETDLGTATLINGGVRVYLSTNSITGYSANIENKVYGTSPSFTFAQSNSNYGPQVNVKFDSIELPFSCNWRAGYSYTASSDNVSVDGPSNVLYEGWSAGKSPTGPTLTFGLKQWIGSWYSVQCACFYDLYPVSGSVSASVDISAPSRPTSLVTPIAIQNPDETYTVYNNITLVDEGNKVVFDPTTGESITFTDWAYDYESRTYDLTLDGGGNMSVQFGNDSITMTQGDTVTNIFYVQDPANDPGTDDPDDPDNPGTDADVSGFFAWWKNAWSGFVDRLFTVLDGGDLEVILPGEEGNPEDEEDDGWTVFDLFALIRDALWKIITGVITVVLDGFLGLVDAIASLGDFFDVYDPANPDGIFGVPGGGVELWS